MHASLRAGLGAVLAVFLVAPAAEAAPCDGVAFGPDFGSYTCDDLSTPEGVPGPLGGIAFLNNNTILIGGAANQGGASIFSVGVVRGAGNHITGFSGPASLFAQAPFIDGGLAFGPDGVLFATGFPNNTLMQFKPGSAAPDKVIDLTALGVTSSVGTLQFVPDGFGGAGSLKIASFSGNTWYDVDLTADGLGTFDVTPTLVTSVTGGPEGIVYISDANDGFDVDSILLAEWSVGRVGAYEIDANGDPILASRRDFMTSLSGAEGAIIDPLTGDFLFSTFGGGDRILVISGFVAPEPPTPGIPEPATLALIGLGLLALARLRRA